LEELAVDSDFFGVEGELGDEFEVCVSSFGFVDVVLVDVVLEVEEAADCDNEEEESTGREDDVGEVDSEAELEEVVSEEEELEEAEDEASVVFGSVELFVFTLLGELGAVVVGGAVGVLLVGLPVMVVVVACGGFAV